MVGIVPPVLQISDPALARTALNILTARTGNLAPHQVKLTGFGEEAASNVCGVLGVRPPLSTPPH